LSLPASDPTIMKAQEALVWSGYYDGPIDGNSGPGTQAAMDPQTGIRVGIPLAITEKERT
jgi:peptidoglycan hydrolase-like protein with peptidoglycan-binding domain